MTTSPCSLRPPVPRAVWIAVLSLCASGCVTTLTLPQYGVIPTTNAAIRELPRVRVKIGEIRSTWHRDVTCRSRTMIPPGDLNFGAYIQQALRQEFQVAGFDGAKGRAVTITGEIEQLTYVDEQPFGPNASWELSVSFHNQVGQSAHVRVLRVFEGAFVASTACQNARDMFLVTVHELVGQAARTPEFRALLASPDK